MVKLVVSILVCLLAGFVGSIATTSSIPTWYASLNKPTFNPPNWVFAPVWTTLFILMGISLALVWNKTSDFSVLRFFFIQLVLNILWSVIFFGLKLPKIAFLEIILLWLAILATILKFMSISKMAGYLLLPYLLWVSLATILNLSIALLN